VSEDIVKQAREMVERMPMITFYDGHKDCEVDRMIARLADEIERLREAIRRIAEQDATLSVCEGNVTVTLDATLTDAEPKPFGLESAMRRIEGGVVSQADAQLVTRRLRECRSRTARWCAVAADAEKAAADARLTDAERELLRSLGPDAERELLRSLGPKLHTHSCYTVTLSAEHRKTVAGLLTRLGGGT